MLKHDLNFIVRLADRTAIDDRHFWRLVWVAAECYPEREKLMLRGFIAQFGIIPESE